MSEVTKIKINRVLEVASSGPILVIHAEGVNGEPIVVSISKTARNQLVEGLNVVLKEGFDDSSV